MTTQEELDKRLKWEGMLDFTAGLTLTRPWYYMKHIVCEQLRHEKVFTLYAKHDLVQGYDFEVEVLRFPRGMFRRREYGITLRAKKESPNVQEGGGPYMNSNGLRRLWGISSITLGSDSTREKRLAGFYESLRSGAIISGTEEFAIGDVRRFLESAEAKK